MLPGLDAKPSAKSLASIFSKVKIFAGVKTFTDSPLVPLPPPSDETQAAASTAFVRGKDFGLALSVAGNALTINLKRPDGTTDPSAAVPVYFDFRSAVAANGGLTRRAVTSAAAYTIASGAAFGATNGVPFKGWIAAFDTGSGVLIAPINCLSGKDIYPLAQFGLASTVNTIAANAQAFYASAALSGMPYVVLGYFSYETGLATAGTWNALPTRLQIYSTSVPLPGAVIARKRVATGNLLTGTAAIPLDDTIPQSSEGFLAMATPYAATSSSHMVDVRSKVVASANASTSLFASALFRSTQADSFAVTGAYPVASGPSAFYTVDCDESILAGVTTSVTYSSRIGASVVDTVTLNGRFSARLYGGACNSYLEVIERAT